MTSPSEFQTVQVCKVDAKQGLVFGFAIVCQKDGAAYYDLQDEHIPEAVMLKAATEFMASERVADEMHDWQAQGTVLFAFPLTADIAKALDITTKQTGLLIGMKPSPEVLAKFVDGTYTGFSIGGLASYKNDEAA